MNTILKLEHIQKYYGNEGNITKAIKDISFSVEAGEFLGIMGASGSGKTTLLNCISTIDTVSAGHIFLEGTDITEINPKSIARFRRENLGFVFQDFNLLDTLTISENIALALAINKVPAGSVEPCILDIAGKLNISDILNKYPYQVSGGQKQRCACARAIINNPKLLLADEPTGALDSHSSQMLLSTIQSINEQLRATILMVTHDAFTASYASRILFLKDGEIFVLAIFMFIAAPILTGWASGYLDMRSMYDVQVYSRYNDVYEEENLPQDSYEIITEFLTEHKIDTVYDCTFNLYLPEKDDFHNRQKYDFPIVAISLSDYNTIREMLGYEQISLEEDEFTTQWKAIATEEERDSFLKEHTSIMTDAGELTLSGQSHYEDPIGETAYNSYTNVLYVLPDNICEKLLPVIKNRYITTTENISYENARKLEKLFTEKYPEQAETGAIYGVRFSTLQINSSIANNFILQTAMIYGAVVLMVICLTVLSLQQLLDAGQYKYRFSVLRKLGVEEKHIGKLILQQLSVWFGLPIITAIIVAAVVIAYFIQTISAEISAYIGFSTLMLQIGATMGILAILLICYFISTWIIFRRSVNP